MSIHKDHREDPNVFETFETAQDRRYHDQLDGPLSQAELDAQIHALIVVGVDCDLRAVPQKAQLKPAELANRLVVLDF